ncbi:MAG TPA: FAD:protein FMN transferase, partial [Patescibacteria group bacterium]|nr:FAD:protein FMN transferase [Patescibacteria group bacterium]
MDSWQFSFEALGTSWVCDLFEKGTFHDEHQAKAVFLSRIDSFDRIYSRFRPDSLVSTISQKEGVYQFPRDANTLFGLYRQLYDLTEGRFTPLVGNLMEEIGYDASYSLKPQSKIHQPPVWDDVLTITDNRITVKKPVTLDVGAGGKGYLLDLLGQLLRIYGVLSYCLDAGGDIVYRTKIDKTLHVGLEHPHDPKQVIGVAEIRNDQSICGSAGNRRAWGVYHHLMDPLTLKPVDAYLASWVIADSGLLADSLTTAIMLVEPEIIQQTFRFEYLLVRPDFSIKKSENF